MEGGTILDVVVVGGGLAGLTAARVLAKVGRSVALFEASERVGGRTLNRSLPDGSVVEGGGEWVGPTQDRVLALARELGVGTYPTYDEGARILHYRGRRRLYRGKAPPLGVLALLDFAQARFRMDRLARELPIARPWEHPDAARYDSMSLEAWLRRVVRTAGARFLFDSLTLLSCGCTPRDISLLFFLSYVRSGGGVEMLESVDGGALSWRLAGGSQVLSIRMAAELGPRVRLHSPVRRLVRRSGHVEVVFDGGSVQAREVIVAVDPAIGRQIEIEPRPVLRDLLCRRWSTAQAYKINVVYETPFWRKAGLCGQVVSDAGAARAVLDNGTPGSSLGVLVTFTGYPLAEPTLFSDERQDDRRAAVLSALATYFGPEAAAPIDYLEQSWAASPWTGGCVPFPPTGLLSGYGPALVEPVGSIHWAGTETADVWKGHMDGAIRSGERAAEEVLRGLPDPTGGPRRPD